LRRALELTVTPRTMVGSQVAEWLVTGGLEPHCVFCEVETMRCDCPDHANGYTCKHLMAVRLANGDRELWNATRLFSETGSLPSLGLNTSHAGPAEHRPTKDDYLDVFALWFEKKRGP